MEGFPSPRFPLTTGGEDVIRTFQTTPFLLTTEGDEWKAFPSPRFPSLPLMEDVEWKTLASPRYSSLRVSEDANGRPFRPHHSHYGW
ncbi:hypothetical protein AVEN_249187-1 [Araneus ventricosus]|uniref:Uncharacterized protein n=1 Tax=Araneus ventricosus TaxID=182803 RepID=A0A4Y2V5K0_ARAVE|nr:hypothetical protein AVEN_249187-1 [Araneus ventricosus]